MIIHKDGDTFHIKLEKGEKVQVRCREKWKSVKLDYTGAPGPDSFVYTKEVEVSTDDSLI